MLEASDGDGLHGRGAAHLLADADFKDDAQVAEELQRDRAAAEEEAIAKSRVVQVEVYALCMYLALVALLSAVIILSRKGQHEFYFAWMVKESVLHSDFETEVAKTFHDVSSLDDIYSFLRGPLLAALYVESSYADRPLPPHRARHVNEQNLLLGPARLQQVRVREVACIAPSSFGVNGSELHIPLCYSSWSDAGADTGPIVGKRPSTTQCAGRDAAVVRSADCVPRAYSWSAASETGVGTFSGPHHSYDGSGYVVELPADLSAARATILGMEEDGFLGQETRALWVDFALYSVNINRFCTVRLLFERLESGEITPSATVRPLSLLWYDGVSRLLAAEVALLSLVVFFIGYELHTMRRQGLRTYWRDISNWYDWPSLLGFALIAFCRYRAWWAMRKVKADLASDGVDGTADTFVNLQEVALWTDHERISLSVDTLLVYLKVLHFLAGVPYISTLLHTLARAKLQLAAAIGCLAVLVLAFASAFHLALGSQMREWRGMGTSVMSLLHFTLGQIDVPGMQRENGAVGPFLFLAFFFLMTVLAISIFLAIITDAYAAEKSAAVVPDDLATVLRNAARRQARRAAGTMGHALSRWRNRIGAIAGTVSRRHGDGEPAHVQPSETLSSDATESLRAPSETPSVAAMRASTGQSGELTLAELARSRQAMEGGHLFVLNGVNTQLKALCFRQDTRETAVRQPVLDVLRELERLRGLNEGLKSRALQEGWVWHLDSAQLLPSSATTAGVAAAWDPVREAAAAAQLDLLGECTNSPTADAMSPCTRANLSAVACARQLARGHQACESATIGTNTDAEEDDDGAATSELLLIEPSSAGAIKLREHLPRPGKLAGKSRSPARKRSQQIPTSRRGSSRPIQRILAYADAL